MRCALCQYGLVYSIVPGNDFENIFENRIAMVMSSMVEYGSS